MASRFDIYKKEGNLNREEKRLIKELERFLGSTNGAEVKPAKTFMGLKRLHEKYCTQEVEFEETTNETTNETESTEEENHTVNEEKTSHEEFRDGLEPEQDDYEDPFSKKEAIVRDYVKDDKFSSNANKNQNASQTVFNEPQNAQQAFELPIEEGGERSSSSGATSEKKEQKKEEPINPKYDDMTAGRKRKSTKKFAKYIVEAVCMLAEKGFVLFAHKNVDKNIFILNEEFGVTGQRLAKIMITLNEGQQASVLQFFENQKASAVELAKIPDDKKEDLAGALAEWLAEKGFAPTAAQELIVISISVFGEKAILLAAHTAQTNSIVEQLRKDRDKDKTAVDTPHEEISRPKENNATEEPQNNQPEVESKAEEKAEEELERRESFEEPVLEAAPVPSKNRRKQVGDTVKE